MNINRLKKNQQGMTLIEIMIAMSLGVFILAGMIKLFSGAKQTNRVMDNLSRMQENGRFAMEFLGRDIRETGFSECLAITVSAAISGTNDDGLNNSDSITVKSKSKVNPNASCSTTPPLKEKIITYTVATGASGLGALFKREVEDKNNDGDTSDAGENVNRELIEGIEKMQILYGVDTDETDDIFTPKYYLSSTAIAALAGVDMDKVVSVRINLLTTSLDNNLSIVTSNYQFSGTSHTPATGDRRMRREFSSTIAVRNRLP